MDSTSGPLSALPRVVRPSVLNPDLIVQEYADLISRYNWQWFCTLTFKDPPHPETAHKKFMMWIYQINNHIYGKNWRRKGEKGVFWCRALEYHKSGVIHFHALVGNPESIHDKLKRVDAASLWNAIGGISKIDAINDTPRACYNYVSKYTSKGGLIDFSPDLQYIPHQLAALSHIK